MTPPKVDVADLYNRRQTGAVFDVLSGATDDSDSERDGLADPSAIRCTAVLQMLPVDWLWRWRIPRAMLSMFDGDPGLCKSTVIIELSARLSRGEPLPGDRDSDGPGDTILISFEDTASHVIVPRLVAAGADRARVHLWDLDAHGFNVVDSLGSLSAAIEAVKARWVVIDPLMAAFPAKLNAHRDQDVRSALAPLAKLAERTGCAITFVRHLNKSGGGNALYRGGGSIGIIGAARSGMILGLDPEDPTNGKDGLRVLAMTKCNVGRPAAALRLRVVQAAAPAPRIEVAKILWEGEADCTADDLVNTEVERAETTEAEAWLKTLLEGGPQPTEDIKKQARKAGLQWRTVERAKKKIGAIAKREGFGAAGVWKWKLPGYESNAGKQS